MKLQHKNTQKHIFISKAKFERDGYRMGKTLRHGHPGLNERQARIIAAALTANYIKGVDPRFHCNGGHKLGFFLGVLLGYGYYV